MSYSEHFRIGAPHSGKLDSLERPWAMLAHLSLLSSPFVPFAGPVVGPLAIMFTVGHREPGVFREANKALNFGITLSIISLVIQYVGYFNGEITSVRDTWAPQFYLFLGSAPFAILAAWHNKKTWPARYGLAIPWVRDPAPRREKRLSRRKRRAQARLYAERATAGAAAPMTEPILFTEGRELEPGPGKRRSRSGYEDS